MTPRDSTVRSHVLRRRSGGLERSKLRMGGALAALCVVVASSLVVTPAAHADATVTTWADLTAAVADGGVVTLGADLSNTQPQNLQIPVGKPVTLDLNGHTLNITGVSPGRAAVNVPPGADFTVTGSGTDGQLFVVGGGTGAGIGGNAGQTPGSITVTGGTVSADAAETAPCGGGGAGIGGGSGADGGVVTISGGRVSGASAQTSAPGCPAVGAGIGGGDGGNGGSVLISDGIVTAGGSRDASGAARDLGAGIGGGRGGDGGSLDVRFGANVAVTSGPKTNGGNAIGNGSGSTVLGSLRNAGFLHVERAGFLTIWPDADAVNSGNLAIIGTLVLAGGTLTNNNYLNLTKGTVVGFGTVVNDGQMVGVDDGGVQDSGTADPATGVLVSTNNYRVVYDLNGHTGVTPPAQRTFSASLLTNAHEIADPPVPPAHYTQAGWNTKADGSGQPISTTALFSTLVGPGPATITAYSVFIAETNTVTFDAQGGSATAPQVVDYGKTASMPADPMRTGFVFDGWFDAATGGTAFDFTSPITAAVTVFAQWSVATNTVTFDAQGGSATVPQVVDYGKTASVPADPTQTGFVFGGWSDAATGGTAFDFTAPITAATTLYAQWSVATNTVSFDAQGGSATAPQVVDYGKTAAIPTDPTQTGFVFGGWSDAATGGTAFDFTAPITAATTLYAQWTAVVVTTGLGEDESIPAGQPLLFTPILTDLGGSTVTVPADNFTATPGDDDTLISINPQTGEMSATSTVPGIHTGTVHSARGDVSTSFTFTTVAAAPAFITLHASATTATQGQKITVTATGTDAYGNDLGDITATTTFTSNVASDSISANEVTFNHASVHTITGTSQISGISAQVAIEVQALPVTTTTPAPTSAAVPPSSTPPTALPTTSGASTTSTTSTTTTTASATATTSPPVSASPSTTTIVPEALAQTGITGQLRLVAALAALAVLVGAISLVFTRRRRSGDGLHTPAG